MFKRFLTPPTSTPTASYFVPSRPTITIVSGLPRSGTSLMMKMLEAGGIPPLQDGIRTADVDNPKGYYELEKVKQLDKGETNWIAQADGKSVKVISALLSFLPNEYDYNILFMSRQLDEVLASQSKMLVRRGASQSAEDDKMKRLYNQHLQQVRNWIHTRPNVSALTIQYQELVQQPAEQIPAINQFLGGRLQTSAMHDVVDPSLYRNRNS